MIPGRAAPISWFPVRMIMAAVAIGVGATAFAGDWPQWHGPSRNGLAPDSVALVDQLSEDGLRLLWTSERIEGGSVGGWGSVAVAGGRAYVFSNHNYDVPIDTRTLADNGLQQLGYAPEMPEELAKLVEAARVSESRLKLRKGEEIDQWVLEWTKTNEKPEWRPFREAVGIRLRAGDKSVAPDLLGKLAGIKDREFPSQAALDDWFAANGIDEEQRRPVMRAIPKTRREAKDSVHCLDLADGKGIWSTEIPARTMSWPGSTTPCIQEGRCYVLNSDAMVYCLDAAQGTVLWKSEPLGQADYTRTRSSSVLVTEGLAVVLTEQGLSALDVTTGKVRWTEHSIKGEAASATVWTAPGQPTRLLCCAGTRTFCLDAVQGKVLWSTDGGGTSTPAVAGDVMVLCGVKEVGLAAYKLAPDGATRLWQIPFEDDYASPVIYGNHVYAFGTTQSRALCVDLATGQIAWDQKIDQNAQYTSPIVADGKVIALAPPWLYLVQASPDGWQLLGKAKVGAEVWTSPALADGKVLVRTGKNVVCYDLSRP